MTSSFFRWHPDMPCVVTPAADIKARQVYYNVPYEDMHAPAVGPAHPFNKDGLAAGMRNHRAGHVEVSCASLFPGLQHSHRFCALAWVAF